MRTPTAATATYAERMDSILGQNEVSRVYTPTNEEMWSQNQYVFNPNFDIDLEAGKANCGLKILPQIIFCQPINNWKEKIIKGDFSGLEGPKLVSSPIYAQHIANQLEEAYGHIGVVHVKSLTNLDKKLCKALQTIVFAAVPETVYELVEYMQPQSVSARIAAARDRIVDLAEQYEVPDLAERLRLACNDMARGSNKNREYNEDYISRSIAAIHAARAGQGGKVVLDQYDIKTLKWLGVEVPEDLLTVPVGKKEKPNEMAEAVQAINNLAQAMQPQTTSVAPPPPADLEAMIEAAVSKRLAAQPQPQQPNNNTPRK